MGVVDAATSNSMYLQCIVEIADNAQALRDEIAPLDDYIASVIVTVENAIRASFVGACNRRLEQSLRGTLTDERLKNENCYALYVSDPALHRIFSYETSTDKQVLLLLPLPSIQCCAQHSVQSSKARVDQLECLVLAAIR
jgi:hypothetical protein